MIPISLILWVLSLAQAAQIGNMTTATVSDKVIWSSEKAQQYCFEQRRLNGHAACDLPENVVVNPSTEEHVSGEREAVPMIEITSYSEIKGKLWACPVGSFMTSEMKGEPAGENTRWITYCKPTPP